MYHYNVMTSTHVVLLDFVSWSINQSLDPHSVISLDDVFSQIDLISFLYPNGVCEMCTSCTSSCGFELSKNHSDICPTYRFLIARALSEPISKHYRFLEYLSRNFKFPYEIDFLSPWSLAADFGIPESRINGKLLFL